MSKALALYTKPRCVQCDATKRHLKKAGIEFTEVNVEEDEGAFRFVTETLGHTAAPVVYTDVDGEITHWSGYQPDLLNNYKEA